MPQIMDKKKSETYSGLYSIGNLKIKSIKLVLNDKIV